jgi:hypothetical protein
MPVQIDLTRELRTPNALAQLVYAVAKASPNDELDWIEWKSSYDLTDRPTQGTIARHILGMANRRPEQARLHAEGCGYLVIGAEPGKVTGVAELDPADLSQAIRPYLGAEGPVWTPGYIPLTRVSVLVVVVNAPRSGDRIFALEKQFTARTPEGQSKTYLAGTIFVRHHGKTEQADPGDIRALEARLLAPRRDADARQLLMEMSGLVNTVLFKVGPHANSTGRFRLPEQNQLAHMIAGHEADYPAARALAGAGQGFEVFAAARDANFEIETRLRDMEAGQ